MTTDLYEPRPRQYTPAFSKGAAVLAEMRVLLSCWTPGESDTELLKRVQSDDLLGKKTASRTHDLVKRVFRPRLLANDDRPARWLKYFVERGGTSDVFREMMLVYSARADDLLSDFVIRQFWPLIRKGDLLIQLDDVIAFLSEAVENRRLTKPWSKNVQIKISRGLLGALRDFGLIREETRQRRVLVNYRVSDTCVAYLIHELHFRGFSDAEIVDHTDWNLFGLYRGHLLDRLEGLGPKADIIVQRAGSVVRITWSYPSMEAFIDAITR